MSAAVCLCKSFCTGGRPVKQHHCEKSRDSFGSIMETGPTTQAERAGVRVDVTPLLSSWSPAPQFPEGLEALLVRIKAQICQIVSYIKDGVHSLAKTPYRHYRSLTAVAIREKNCPRHKSTSVACMQTDVSHSLTVNRPASIAATSGRFMIVCVQRIFWSSRCNKRLLRSRSS